MIQRLELKKSDLNPNFIGSWLIEENLLCQSIINNFESQSNKQNVGSFSGGVNPEFKDSVDLTILPAELDLPNNALFKTYFNYLFECYKDYLNQWPFLKSFCSNVEIGGFNVQRYKAGQHFKEIHTERSNLETLHRIFAFMTYLNDVEEGGSTFFSHYNLEVQPKKGLTLIWPAEWTHAHKGNILKAGSKYIVTGWMHFPN